MKIINDYNIIHYVFCILFSDLFFFKVFFHIFLFFFLFADNSHRIFGNKISLYGEKHNLNKALQTLKYQPIDFYIGIDKLNFIIRNSFNLTTIENIILIIKKIYVIPIIKISNISYNMAENSVLLLSDIVITDHSKEHSSESSAIITSFRE